MRKIVELERLYPSDVAAELVPFPSVAALHAFVSKNADAFPPHALSYRRTQKNGRSTEQRFFTETEIKRMREMTFHGPEKAWHRTPTFLASVRAPKKPRSPIDAIIARAIRSGV